MSSRSPSSEAGSGETDRIAVGRILRPHGIRGEVKVEVWSDVADRFAVGAEMFPRRPDRRGGTAPAASRRRSSGPLCVTGSRRDRGLLLIRFAGIDDRDGAEDLQGAVLEVETSQVPEAPEGYFYFFQLVGCQVVDRAAGTLGEVTEVLEDGGGHLLSVHTARGIALVPFVDAFLRRIDVETRLIEVELPEGLIESCTSPS